LFDSPLSPLGESQAVAAARSVGAVDAIVASSLQRAWQTAEIIADELGIGPVEIEPDLRERDLGAWTGLTTDEIKARWPGAVEIGADPEGGEARDHVVVRAVKALRRVAHAHPAASVLGVSHGGVIRFLEHHLGCDAVPLRNLGGRQFIVDGDTITPGDPVHLVDPHDERSREPRTL
jgi:probable phosphoglycerate mutase